MLVHGNRLSPGSNASFKGWATPVASALVPCGLTGHANGTCWSSKPGNSSPPATIERYISVIVSTSIVKNGSSIDGNIAAVVVLRVDASSAYANDPGKPGYGTIVAVITDGARLFGTSTPATTYAGYFFRHLATPRTQIAPLTHPDLATLFPLTTPTAHVTSVLHPAPLTVASGTKRYSFYTPEMHLLAETALTTTGTPASAYEYIWFNGHAVAQIDAGGATHWTFTDHLGTPILLTNNDATTYWRAEYEPFGAVYALRSADVHQPLRLPGQEAEQLNLGGNGVTEREYNIFRWYRAGWGRYTQTDPYGVAASHANLYIYAGSNPELFIDPSGQVAVRQSYTRRGGSGFGGGGSHDMTYSRISTSGKCVGCGTHWQIELALNFDHGFYCTGSYECRIEQWHANIASAFVARMAGQWHVYETKVYEDKATCEALAYFYAEDMRKNFLNPNEYPQKLKRDYWRAQSDYEETHHGVCGFMGGLCGAY